MAYIVCKMTKINVCRICLVQEFQEACLLPKANKQLEIIYEKFTNKPFKTEDGRPSSVCRICCHLLLKCQRFVESAVKADEKLQQLWSSGVEITEQSLSTIDRKFVFASFTRSPVSTTNVTAENTVEIQVEVKREGEKLSGDVIEEDPTDTQTSTRQSDWVKLKTEKPPSGDPLQLADVHEENVFDIKIENYVDESDVSENSNFVKCGPQNEEERATMSASPVRLRHECAACCRGFESASELYQHNRDHDESSAEFECAACHIRCRTAADLKRHEDVDHQRYPGDSLYGIPAIKRIQDLQIPIPGPLLEFASSTEKIKAPNETITKGMTAIEKPIDIAKLQAGRNIEMFTENVIALYNKRIDNIKDNPDSSKQSTFIFPCQYCEETFTDKMVLKDHTKTQHAHLKFKCSYCDKTFAKKYVLTIHERVHTGEKPFSCDYCLKKYSRIDDLKSHIKVHTGEKPFSCEYCKKSYTRMYYLKNHMKIHTGENVFSCGYCQKTFFQKDVFRSHLRIHTGQDKIECGSCGKTFSHKNYLKIHSRVHTGEKPYSCEICGKSFAQKVVLTRHMLLHMNNETFSCEFCKKSFTQKYYLKRHMKVHSAEKPYVCNHCGKRFNFKINLVYHERVHTGEKPCSCEFCGKSFARRSHLKNHLKTHTGEKPFSCEHCGKDFAIKGNLISHIRTHTGK
ncbi:zinc finger protein 271-like isoform X4 [Ostrinia furnacalis]|uniref:zinc finger protein 271-like isoform X4 n=1 Tax=Ostrinia furnacalis TaxID=93504 RepID=UPI00103F14C8|nr:zinc finger protein 271-like isoform X4 [Ostrinia furnacalis]